MVALSPPSTAQRASNKSKLVISTNYKTKDTTVFLQVNLHGVKDSPPSLTILANLSILQVNSMLYLIQKTLNRQIQLPMIMKVMSFHYLKDLVQKERI